MIVCQLLITNTITGRIIHKVKGISFIYCLLFANCYQPHPLALSTALALIRSNLDRVANLGILSQDLGIFFRILGFSWDFYFKK